MELDTIEKKINWEEYYSDSFNWENANYSILPLTDEFIKEFAAKINWYRISESVKLDEDFIRKYKDYVHWSAICKYQRLSEIFLEEFKDKVDWKFVSHYQSLSYNFVIKFKNKIDWEMIFYYHPINCHYIDELISKYNILEHEPNKSGIWMGISAYQHLEEWFVDKYRYNLNALSIFSYQKLSEEKFKELLLDTKFTKNITITRCAQTLLKKNTIGFSKEFIIWLHKYM